MWVLTDKRYRVETYGAKNLEHVADDLAGIVAAQGEASYDEYLDDATASAGGRLMVTEYARDLRSLDVPAEVAELIDDQTSFYLTRFHARIPADSLADAVLGPGTDSVEVLNEVTLILPRSAAGWAVVMLLAFVGLGRRRRS